ncbi:alpha/beta fold hydrolase [Paucibacter sp. APW11]|uniref:Alpha/beta fold hydrolase n=1 Tax=Roseateles aquae TaxID=3077235 RepID=A0ABU3PH12_9BURK|nr:alpha/beta hydrolase [Paucibacter sp. APW11]MDT9001866.1 alpha/beta fold hydrolase [Paucibacter sp. APW11]
MNLRRLGRGAAFALLGLSLVFLIGPRNAELAWEPLPKPAPLPAQLSGLDAYLAAAEARLGNVTPGTEKHIVWGPQGQQKAPWAVVYLHGFTATRHEIAPLPEKVAEALGGHVFYTRLSGHGQPGEAMGQATLAHWKADAQEALRIGHQLGERVLVIGNSTGATLSAWLAQREEGAGVAGWVLVSPNFGPKNRWAQIINWPWGRQLARLLQGAEQNEAPRNALKARFWTHRYPTEALFPMMALVKQVNDSALESIKAPTLMMLSPRDTIIDVEAARAAYARLGSANKRLSEIDFSESLNQHVLAGDIEAPAATAPMAAQIVEFARGLNPAASQTASR